MNMLIFTVPMILLAISILILAAALIWTATRPRKIIHITKVQGTEAGDKEFDAWFITPPPVATWDGPVPSKEQEEKNLQGIFDHLEKFPNGILAEKNPEYKEEYLKRIDLDLPPGIHTEVDSNE
jgi:hypothetical protein